MNTTSRRIAEVERYIHELAIALAGLPVEEREDVIAGVREHIDDALLAIDDPGVADVQRILEDLGDPLAIAADAGARTTSPEETRTQSWNARTGTETPPTPAADARPYPPGFDQPPPLLQRTWIPAATILAFPVAALLLWAGGPGVAAPAAVLWILGLVVLLASPLWSGLESSWARPSYSCFSRPWSLFSARLTCGGMATGHCFSGALDSAVTSATSRTTARAGSSLAWCWPSSSL